MTSHEIRRLTDKARHEVELGDTVSKLMANWIDAGLELRRTLANHTAALAKLIPALEEAASRLNNGCGDGEVES
jgi:hypothetical protein